MPGHPPPLYPPYACAVHRYTVCAEPRASVKPGTVDPRKQKRAALAGVLKKLNLRTFAKKLRAEGIDDLETITYGRGSIQ